MVLFFQQGLCAVSYIESELNFIDTLFTSIYKIWCDRVTLRFDDGRSISNREKQKLFKKLLSSPLGETLVCKYLDYWSASPKKVARILHGIAVFSNQLKSLHSITDLVSYVHVCMSLQYTMHINLFNFKQACSTNRSIEINAI